MAHCLDGAAAYLFYRDELEAAALVAAGVQELRRSLSTIRAPYEDFFQELDDFRDRIDETHPEAAAYGRGLSRPELVDYTISRLTEF
ncbi:MAG: hypothetical protein WB239_06470 [Acidimicrobiia bacterium]